MADPTAKSLVDEATFEFTMGDHDKAIALLERACEIDPACFDAWHARAEILFDARRFEEALAAANVALMLHEEDVHLHTTLSRIHMELGDKQTAETHGARARVLGWKATLKGEEDDGSLN